ncbi:hypothetical protein [Acidicapsa ligni]|uniref:hypothetical protein n=1 Tax=Acidicapsa ligni TaxID=542300 RepID=UPI0021E09144|nr:hypothetical protein [Acidicapsa ligni]
MSLYLIVILAGVGAIYTWNHRTEFSLLRAWLPSHSAEGVLNASQGNALDWREVDESNSGFKLEMPGEPRRVTVQATSETGMNEPVNMLLVKPDSDSSFAIAWADKPPVARVNDLIPDKTLDQARDGEMARTDTSLVSENRNAPQGFPGRDIVTHNAGGGVLDTRFVYAGSRLYMLIAASPSSAARREEAVIRFFNSFTVAGNTQIPETLPAATQ